MQYCLSQTHTVLSSRRATCPTSHHNTPVRKGRLSTLPSWLFNPSIILIPNFSGRLWPRIHIFSLLLIGVTAIKEKSIQNKKPA